DMPEMDGLQATAAIRENEQTSSHRATIIALTARTVPGAREACMAAGMDGFLGKPVTPELLLPLMEQLMFGRGRMTERASRPAIDRQQVLDRIDGDEDLLAELSAIFQAESPRMLESLRTAIEALDAAAVHRVAHTLKGSVAIF